MNEEKRGLRGFPATFWVANVMELFERGAYYGMNSVLAIYMTEKKANGGLGFAEDAVGFLQAIIYALVYVIPILGGALAEKFGYRKMLIAAFSILTFGYFATGSFSSYGMVFGSLCILATGAGLFKPIISGTIARTTNEANSGFGFGIYYWMINLGAFISPIIVSYLRGFSWKYVFIASSLWCFLMLLPSIFIYKDPKLPGKSLSLKQTAVNAVTVLRDCRFMLMIFIYSIFWILYFQNFSTILWYLRDFVNKTPVNELMTNFFNSIGLHINFVFGEEYVTTINAGIIILLQVFVSYLVKKKQAIPVMSTGMIVGSFGFLILGLTAGPWFFILGIIVFSIGEMTVHPKYYSYIGIIAPEDKKAIYMGYAFLYGVIGSLFGSSFGAYLYIKLAAAGKVKLFFLLFAAFCLLGSAALILYNKFLSADTPENNRIARKIVLSIYTALIIAGAAMIASHFPPSKGDFKLVANSIILFTVGAAGFSITIRKDSNA